MNSKYDFVVQFILIKQLWMRLTVFGIEYSWSHPLIDFY